MAMKYFGKRLKRNEDPRLLIGQALFVDDVNLPKMLHVAFLRSPYAHARLNTIDASQAREREGVVAVYTARDLGDYWCNGPLLVSPLPVEGIVFNERTQPILAMDKVHHLGEPIAAVVAESRYLAEDALTDILVDYEPLSAVVDLEAALMADSTLVHEDVGSNVAAHVVQTFGDYGKVKANAHTVIKRRLDYDHGTAAALENRGIVAEWDPRSQRLTVWDTTQAPNPIRNGLATMPAFQKIRYGSSLPLSGVGSDPRS